MIPPTNNWRKICTHGENELIMYTFNDHLTLREEGNGYIIF